MFHSGWPDGHLIKKKTASLGPQNGKWLKRASFILMMYSVLGLRFGWGFTRTLHPTYGWSTPPGLYWKIDFAVGVYWVNLILFVLIVYSLRLQQGRPRPKDNPHTLSDQPPARVRLCARDAYTVCVKRWKVPCSYSLTAMGNFSLCSGTWASFDKGFRRLDYRKLEVESFRRTGHV